MTETTNMTNMRTHAGVSAAEAEGAGGGYYHVYYREVVIRHASRVERNRRLEEIRRERRRVRRGKWLKGMKSLASVLTGSEAVG